MTSPVKRGSGSRLRIVGALIAVATVYVGMNLLLRPDAFFVGDMGVKYVQVESLLRQRFRTLALIYPAASYDPEGEFFPLGPPCTFEMGGRAYSVFPPSFAVITAIPYCLLGCRGLYVIPLLAGVATLGMIPLLAKYLRIRRPAGVILFAALATPLSFYSLLFWEHTLAAFFFTVSLFFAVRAFRLWSARDVAWCGIFAGMSPWFRTEMFMAIAAMAVAFALMAHTWRTRFITVFLFTIGAALFTIPLLVLNLWLYGGVFGAHFMQNIHFDQSVPLGATWLGALLLKIYVLPRHLLFGREFFNVRWQDVALFAPFVAILALWFVPQVRWKVATRTALLLACAGVAVYVACTTSTAVGFFAASPAMILAFAGANPLCFRERRLSTRSGPLGFCYLVCIIFCVLFFASSPVLGGVQFGPRFLLPLYVPAALLSARTWRMGITWHERLSTAAGAVLVFCSLWMSAQGMDLAYHQKATAGEVKDTILRTPCKIVVTDVHLFSLIGPAYFERMLFKVSDQTSLHKLEGILTRRGESGYLFVTRTVKPIGPVGITVAAATAPEVPVMRASDITYMIRELEPARCVE